jgi:hypothetical protein
VTVRIEQNILRFKISVNDAKFVEIRNSLDNLSCINLDSKLVKSLFSSKICEKLSSVDKIKDKVEFGIGLESKMETDYIRTVHLFINASFS